MFSMSTVDYRTLTLWVFGFPVFSLNLSAVQELLPWQQFCFLTGNINSFSHSRWHHFPFCLTTTIMVKAYLENSLAEQLFYLHYASLIWGKEVPTATRTLQPRYQGNPTLSWHIILLTQQINYLHQFSIILTKSLKCLPFLSKAV